MAKKDNTQTLKDLSDALAADLGVSKAKANAAAQKLFASIVATVKKGGKVRIHQFGTFKSRETKARTGRNPQTGASIKVNATKTVGFKAVPSLKEKKGKK